MSRGTKFVRPASPGLIVRNPERLTEILPAEGAEWPDTEYLRRRIADGDVIEVKRPVAKPVADEKRPAPQARKTAKEA